jgi:hypothetical protein
MEEVTTKTIRVTTFEKIFENEGVCIYWLR